MNNEEIEARKKLEELASEFNLPEKSELKVDFVDNTKPPTSLPPKKSNMKFIYYSLIGLLVVMVLLVGVLGVVFMSRNSNDAKTGDDTDTADNRVEPTDEESPVTEEEDKEEEKKIVYYNYATGEVGIMNEDGTGKTELEGTSIEDGQIYEVSSKSSNELSISGCIDSTCEIFVYNLETDTEELVLTIENAIGVSYEWSNDGETLVYYVRNVDAGWGVYKLEGDEKTTIEEWDDEILGRGGSFADEISIKFSPDESKFIFTDTVGGGQLGRPIIVYDIDGDVIYDIEVSSGSSATGPLWLNNDEIVYTKGDSLVRLNLDTDVESVLETGFGYYSAEISPDRTKIAATKYGDSGEIETWVYDIGADSMTLVEENFVLLKWIDNSNILGKTTEPELDGFSGYVETSLARVNISGVEFKVLIDEQEVRGDVL